MNYIYKYSFIFLSVALGMTSCVDQEKFKNIGVHSTPRVEYAPNMYYDIAYEPLKQVTEVDEGKWVSSDQDKYGEYYNSNPYNPHNMTMREPAPNTVARSVKGFLPYRLPKDCVAVASNMTSPLKVTPAVLDEGKILYSKFCTHCHGEGGLGDGPVNDKLKGVANLTTGTAKTSGPGYIFHVITWGRGRMGAHKSLLNQEERWKIAHYVKESLQQAEAQ